MGNTDSHGHSVSPVKSSHSLWFSSGKEEVPSARGWWRSCRNREAAVSPFTSWQGAPVEGGGGSPKVLLGKDGSVRVEFSRKGAEAREVAVATGSSQGGSLSSDTSWYDSPWGGGPTDGSVFAPGLSSALLLLPAVTKTGRHKMSSSGQTEDSGVGDSLIMQPDLEDLSPAAVHGGDSSCSTPEKHSDVSLQHPPREVASPDSVYSSYRALDERIVTPLQRRWESLPQSGVLGKVESLDGSCHMLTQYTPAPLQHPARKAESPDSIYSSDRTSDKNHVATLQRPPKDAKSPDSVYNSCRSLDQSPVAPLRGPQRATLQDRVLGEVESPESTYSSYHTPEERLDVTLQRLLKEAESLDSIYSSCCTLDKHPAAPRPCPRMEAETPDAVNSSCRSLDEFLIGPIQLPQRATPWDCVLTETDSTVRGGAESVQCTPPSCDGEAPPTRNNRKDSLKSRIKRLSDWTGSLSRKRRRIQEPSRCTSSGGLDSVCTSSSNQNHDAQRQNIYENFMQGLEPDGPEPSLLSSSEEEEETAMDGEVQPLELQAAVRRAGWLSFKPLLTIGKERKLELVKRRRWRRYWVTLKGCSLLLYETLDGDQERCPCYVLHAEDGMVQAIPEHPRREHVFCLSNGHGDVYLLQAGTQTDLENWVTAIHSSSAALLAGRRGDGHTLRLLRRRCRSLLHRIDTDRKMKKMAELQLSVIGEPRNRRAVENQIQQWEQNLEQLNLELFRFRCYLSSLQGGELPNPKSLLAAAARRSKSMLGRLGVFSVSSFHALVCSRDDATLRRCRFLSARNPRRRAAASESQDRTAEPPLQNLDLDLNLDQDQEQDRDQDRDQDQDQDLELNLELRRDKSLDQEEAEVQRSPGSPGFRLPVPSCENSGGSQQSVDRGFSLYQTFPECQSRNVDVLQNPYGREAELQNHYSRKAELQNPYNQEAGLQNPYNQKAELETQYSQEAGLHQSSPAHLSICQRLRKVIEELVDTEKSYVKDLVCLFDLYLSPLQKETFLRTEEMEALFGSLPEMLNFQRVFLQTLEKTVTSCPNFSSLNSPEQFQRLLLSLGASFLHYAEHFKLYGGFCADHVKVQKVLERARTDGAFKNFLDSRNPTNQHSASLESYLIKPVQRILKYPLLLRELVSLTPPNSREHTHLAEALRAMEQVASHINEVQKISEDYGGVFQQLAAEQSGPGKQVTEVSMGEFLVQASVLWLNPLPCVGRLRKDPELKLFVFRRAVVLVYRDVSRLRKRMAASRSAALDPFRFRWLIPGSAVQVRPATMTGSVDPCVWELIHSRSEVEGRPETVFQLCSRNLRNVPEHLNTEREK